MDVLVEQCYAIKLCTCFKKNTVETILLLQETFTNKVLRVLMIKRWHKMFMYGGESTEFEPQSGKPKTMCAMRNINTIATPIEDNCHQSVRVLVTEMEISQKSIRCTIFSIFRNFKCILASFKIEMLVFY